MLALNLAAALGKIAHLTPERLVKDRNGAMLDILPLIFK